MLLQSAAMHQNVVNECEHPFSQQWSKNSVHTPLESARASGHTIGHHFELKVVVMSFECSFVLVLRHHKDLMVSSFQVQAREPTRTC